MRLHINVSLTVILRKRAFLLHNICFQKELVPKWVPIISTYVMIIGTSPGSTSFAVDLVEQIVLMAGISGYTRKMILFLQAKTGAKQFETSLR